MIKRKTYVGILDGHKCIHTDFVPEGMIVEEEYDFYTPDEGKIFVKDGEYYDCVIIRDGEDINNYEEADAPEPEPVPELNEE